MTKEAGRQWYANNGGNLTETGNVPNLQPVMDPLTRLLYGREWAAPAAA
jgi:hypothetical protein